MVADTLPETNIPRLKIGLPKKESSIPTIHFQGRTVSFRESNLNEGIILMVVSNIFDFYSYPGR